MKCDKCNETIQLEKPEIKIFEGGRMKTKKERIINGN